MSEDISIDLSAPKELKYAQLLPQIEALVGDDKNEVAVLANVSAALHQTFDFLWTGFYIVKHDQLVLGPFQGPIACMRISYGQGVCGTAWKKSETIVVPDVEKYPGHIACSSESKSEIVVPIEGVDGTVKAVLDVDSHLLNTFNHIDVEYLDKLCSYLGKQLY